MYRSATLRPLLLVTLLGACAEAPVMPLMEHSHHHAPSSARVEAPSAAQNQINAELRQATARYQRVEVALADGYALASPCIPGMGYHYLNEALLDGTVDPARPEVLVYAPQKNGRLQLVAVEFMVPAAAWDRFHDGPPMLGSRAFDDYRDPELAAPLPPHYQLHAWVWKHNPAGIYTPDNPNVSCD